LKKRNIKGGSKVGKTRRRRRASSETRKDNEKAQKKGNLKKTGAVDASSRFQRKHELSRGTRNWLKYKLKRKGTSPSEACQQSELPERATLRQKKSWRKNKRKKNSSPGIRSPRSAVEAQPQLFVKPQKGNQVRPTSETKKGTNQLSLEEFVQGASWGRAQRKVKHVLRRGKTGPRQNVKVKNGKRITNGVEGSRMSGRRGVDHKSPQKDKT